MRIAVTDQTFEIFPELSVHILVMRDIDQQQLAGYQLPDHLPTPPDESYINDLITQWRDLLRQFPSDKKSRCSIEYLLKASAAGKLRAIDPLVDLYNIASLRSHCPFGGEDISKIGELLQLAVAVGDEPFIPLGKDEVQLPKPGEVAWMDGERRIVCRALNWLESDLHKITPEARDVVFVSERANYQLPDPSAGMDYLQAELTQRGAAQVARFTLDSTQRTLDVSAG